MPQSVLIIDPDNLERRRLRRTLSEAGFEVVEAGAAIEGLFETLEQEPDLILLAEEVPPLVAEDLLLVLRRLSSAPVVVIGSGGDPEEVSMLDLGADFYQRRPLSMPVIVARVRSLIRRRRPRNRLSEAGAAVKGAPFSPTEERLLTSLIARRGRPVSLADLAGQNHAGPAARAAARMALWRLRRKLGDSGLRLIVRRGVGYMLLADRLETWRAAS